MRASALTAEIVDGLAKAGVPDVRFEAELLVRGAAGIDRARYFTDPDLSEESCLRARQRAERRRRREPAAYIQGDREFWGRRFVVTPDVLIPRPETELLVELALEEAPATGRRPVIADIGTGSGCIAVSIAADLGDRARIVATDVSAAALRVARRNAAANDAVVGFAQGDLAASLGRVDILLANLPYIPSAEVAALEPEVSFWEPRVALDGGGDGFVLIRRLVADCRDRLRPRLSAFEVGFGMAAACARLLRDAGAQTATLKDLAGIDRVVCARWP
ncbi:MAG: peptide chain release factor N(5)-glutamine methyltransferase [Dehalococcoidia bacterium]